MTFGGYEGTVTGRISSNPYKPGDRVRVLSGLYKGHVGTVVHDNGGPELWISVAYAEVNPSRIHRVGVERVDAISELGDVVR